MARDPAEQLLRGLHDHAALACEVARAQHCERVVGEGRRHPRTIRSTRRSRNRRSWGLAWLIFLALGLLVLVATRASAAPIGQARDGAGLAERAEEDDDTDDERCPQTIGDDADPDCEPDDDADADAEPADGDPRAGEPVDDARAELVATGVTDEVDAGSDAGFDDSGRDDGYLDDAFGLAGTALGDIGEQHEHALRHRHPSRLGRLDLTIAWRRRWSPSDPLDPSQIASALTDGRSIDGGVRHTDTFWLTATWRK